MSCALGPARGSHKRTVLRHVKWWGALTW